MAKEMFSNRVDADLVDALRAEARGESRSVANMLEVVLRERYGGLAGRSAAVVDSGPVVQAGADGTATGKPAPGQGEGSSPGRSASPSVAAATVSSVGRAHYKRDRPAVECSGRVVSGGVCVECGAEL